MENHLNYLKNLCRLCAGKIVLKRGYINAKKCADYVNTLKDLGVLPDEDAEVYIYIYI